MSIEDIRESEMRFTEKLKTMLHWSKEDYEALGEINWTTRYTDGTITSAGSGLEDQGNIIDISDAGNGHEKLVEFKDIERYVSRALRSRLTISKVQCEAIKRGISQIVPQALLSMSTSEELEEAVCGKNYIDLELLKRHTKYSGGSEQYQKGSKLMNMFWDFMEEITPDDGREFIKFCWGQSRLPPDDAAFERQNLRFTIQPKEGRTEQDKMLPGARTCFFILYLPNYSTYNILKAKILKAVQMDSVSMMLEEGAAGRGGGRGFEGEHSGSEQEEEE